MTSDGCDLETEYPAIPAAYDFVLPSYGWMLARYEAANARIQSIITAASGFTFAALVWIREAAPSGALDYTSVYFLAPVAVFAVIIIGGLWARSTGVLSLMDPGRLYGQHLGKDPIEFKKDMIHYASMDFADNKSAVARKSNAVRVLLVLLGLELVLLFVWGFRLIGLD